MRTVLIPKPQPSTTADDQLTRAPPSRVWPLGTWVPPKLIDKGNTNPLSVRRRRNRR